LRLATKVSAAKAPTTSPAKVRASSAISLLRTSRVRSGLSGQSRSFRTLNSL